MHGYVNFHCVMLQQVLRLLSGDSEDHAILLCCYLLKLGLKAWLLLGSGVPHGATAYVLTKSPTSDYILWDPPTGNKFSILDSFCPLHKVFCLVNQDNVSKHCNYFYYPLHINLFNTVLIVSTARQDIVLYN